MNIADRVADRFEQRFGHRCEGIARAPGRVNLLGEHVDYNDGFVLPVATDRATYVAFRASDSGECVARAEDYQREVRFSPDTLRDKRDTEGATLEAWAKYPAGVAWSLMEAGLPVKGVNAVYASDVPQGAGLSSSASVELAFALAWMTVGETSIAPMQLAKLCQRAENEYVGVNCGIMDQAASACSEAGHVMMLDCRSLEYTTLALPPEVAIIIADSGVRRNLATSAYNERRSACEEAVRLLRADLPTIRALRDVTQEEFDRLAPELPPVVEMRARHVVEEIGRTRRAAEMLRNGDVRGFGRLMDSCQASLRDLYEVSCPELDAMTSIAQAQPGCHGSRLTGAGFGGCTVNLVERACIADFAEALRRGYESATQKEAEIYVSGAAGGACILDRGQG